MTDSPAAMGYRMPAEWEKHEATWVSWPKDPDTFPSETLPRVERAFAALVDALSTGEQVRILVDDDRLEARARSMVQMSGDVSFHHIKTVDVWVRDYGPIYLSGTGAALTKWEFNAWGRKYDDLLPDNEAGQKIAESEGIPVFRTGMVLEGGSIDVNGAGTLLTTEQCLLDPSRNPRLKRSQIEGSLASNLGLEKIVWLRRGIEGDDTDGHVDDMARFVGPKTIVVAVEKRTSDPNYGPLEEDLGLLNEATDQDGSPFELIPLPMPPALESDGVRLPASHANFYVGNSAVVVPTFGGESDSEAIRVLQQAFPSRDVQGIDCRALAYGLGTLHCVTQQVPAHRAAAPAI